MREIAVIAFVTMDGVAQGPVQPDEDTSNGFKHSGWASAYMQETMALVNAQVMEAPLSLLFGRKTYEMFAGHWPSNRSSQADLLNNSSKYVVSTTLKNASWDNTRIIQGDVIEEIKRLKQGQGPRLQVHGSIELIQTLIVKDLIDEYRLFTFPVLLGSGKQLFGQSGQPVNFQLTKLAQTDTGVVMSVYRRQQ